MNQKIARIIIRNRNFSDFEECKKHFYDFMESDFPEQELKMLYEDFKKSKLKSKLKNPIEKNKLQRLRSFYISRTIDDEIRKRTNNLACFYRLVVERYYKNMLQEIDLIRAQTAHFK